jgi:hypothetical protein
VICERILDHPCLALLSSQQHCSLRQTSLGDTWGMLNSHKVVPLKPQTDALRRLGIYLSGLFYFNGSEMSLPATPQQTTQK